MSFCGGEQGLRELAARDVDILVSAIVGAAGLVPSAAAIGHAKRIALANKETLVAAGDWFIKQTQKSGTELVPVDSEHSAVFALLEGRDPSSVQKIILTASGGSLRDKTLSELAHVTAADALNHPTWDMGKKITIDSATLMNKGLEVIEAHHLFDMPYEKIDVVIHPESAIHSLVEMADGALFAHLSVADMALPILQALMFPQKRVHGFGSLNLAELGALHFFAYDAMRFPALNLCRAAGITGGTAPAVLNAANECAVYAFLENKISFVNIVHVVQDVLNAHVVEKIFCIGDALEADRRGREKASQIIRGMI